MISLSVFVNSHYNARASDLKDNLSPTPPTPFSKGAVASDSELVTNIGIQVLSQGGNAVDAAVASAFAINVALPFWGGMGGGGFSVGFINGKSYALDFRDIAPQLSQETLYLDDKGQRNQNLLEGHLASCVPGFVMGLWELHKKYGKLPWKQLLKPAIQLADSGFPISSFMANMIKENESKLGKYSSSRSLYLKNNQGIPVGTVLKNPNLARTLKRISDKGVSEFYLGQTAQLIVNEMKRGGGIITSEDLKEYRAVWREPIIFSYKGYTVISNPPPGSSGITLAIVANLLSEWDLSKMSTLKRTHYFIEGLKRAFMVRNNEIADPSFYQGEFPLKRLLSPGFSHQLGSSISEDRATPSNDLLCRYYPSEAKNCSKGLISQGIQNLEETETTHLSVADENGNAVALTMSVRNRFGSGVTIPDAGFIMNEMIDDFSIGGANAQELEQGRLNKLEPRKRPLSSQTPTIILSPSGQVRLVTGASGGAKIISAVFQIFFRAMDDELAEVAVSWPRIHHQHLPDKTLVEPGAISPEDLKGLRQLGHHIEFTSLPIAAAPSLLRTEKGWIPLADARRPDSDGKRQ